MCIFLNCGKKVSTTVDIHCQNQTCRCTCTHNFIFYVPLFMEVVHPFFQVSNCTSSDYFEFPCHLGSYILSSSSISSRVELVHAALSCVRTMVWQPATRIFNMRANVTYATAHRGLYRHWKRACSVWNSTLAKKMPYCTGNQTSPATCQPWCSTNWTTPRTHTNKTKSLYNLNDWSGDRMAAVLEAST